jgi:hypothetical protein
MTVVSRESLVLYRTTERYKTQMGADFQLVFLQGLDPAILSLGWWKQHLFSKEGKGKKQL